MQSKGGLRKANSPHRFNGGMGGGVKGPGGPGGAAKGQQAFTSSPYPGQPP